MVSASDQPQSVCVTPGAAMTDTSSTAVTARSARSKACGAPSFETASCDTAATHKRAPPSTKNVRTACQSQLTLDVSPCGVAPVRCAKSVRLVNGPSAHSCENGAMPTKPAVLVATPSIGFAANEISSTYTPGARYSGITIRSF